MNDVGEEIIDKEVKGVVEEHLTKGEKISKFCCQNSWRSPRFYFRVVLKIS